MQDIIDFNSEKLKTIFTEIGLASKNAREYLERAHKYPQVAAYITQIHSALNKLSTKRPIVFLDCGCGRSYLSFILYQYCREILKREIKIIGVDTNAELITKCQLSASELTFTNMEFHTAKIEDFTANTAIDVVYSLHACDKATDQTLAKAVNVGARYIFSVSCCQHTNRKNIAKHPLTSVTKHGAYKERLVDMLGDSMRALILEHFGYGTKIFEFVAAKHTPKNIMLRAEKNNAKKIDQEVAIAKYKALVEMFNFSPVLAELLSLERSLFANL